MVKVSVKPQTEILTTEVQLLAEQLLQMLNAYVVMTLTCQKMHSKVSVGKWKKWVKVYLLELGKMA